MPDDPASRLRPIIRELAQAGFVHRCRQQELRKTPGTGPQRHALRVDYVATTRPQARHAQLAYAFLRGRSYHSVERRCQEEPSAGWVLTYLLKVEPETPPAKADIERWLQGEESTYQTSLLESRRAGFDGPFSSIFSCPARGNHPS